MTGIALMLTVTAGVLLDEPLPQYTKTWNLTRQEYEDPDKWRPTIGDATIYALMLQDPARVNWVRLDWIWV